MPSRTVAAIAIVTSIALAGCSGQQKSASAGSSAALNTTCPFSGKPANETFTVAYNDRQVAFCCNGCKGRFEKMTDEQRSALMAKAK